MKSALDAVPVQEALGGAADRDLAARALGRVLEAQPELAEEVGAGGQILDAIVALSAASDTLTTVLTRDPGALAVLRAPDLTSPRDRAALHQLVIDEVDDAADALEALRVRRHRELMRIAARDLLGWADLRVVGAELSVLADACLAGALHVASPVQRFAIVGMGKLGGRELNYASDVDVLFVHDGESATAVKLAREVLRVMTTRTANGIVFRTDADLRPEGRDGPLSRSIESFAAYWDRWAAGWELQALLKARPVAGDPELGKALVDAAEPRIWPDVMDRDRIRETRLMKQRAEHLLDREGTADRDLKLGRGGIRDIEFSVQLLQLVHGRHDASVRDRTTLDALERLAGGGYVSIADATEMDDAYVWLRTTEHRLQLWQEQQTHTLPVEEAARHRLARVMGFRASLDESAAERFDAHHRQVRASVRRVHERLFFAPILDTLGGTGHLPPDAVAEGLDAFGFHDVDQTRRALEELTSGLARGSRVMQDLFPAVLGWLAEGADPDLGLLQLRRLAEGYTRSQSVVRLFRETPHGAQRMCQVLASSRVMGVALHRQPEAIVDFADDSRIEYEPTRDELLAEALGTLDWRHDEEGRWAGLRRFKRRQVLRIGTRDLVGGVDAATTGRELTNVADAALGAALAALEPRLPFAVIGMGSLGGGELSYASDIDVLFVYEGAGSADFEEAERTATRLMKTIGATTSDGQTWKIDADLRPEGKKGVLTRSLDSYREYYERWGEQWERQAMLRSRAAVGDPDLGRAFCDLVEPLAYRPDFSADDAREVRRMKARIEKERIPHGTDPRWHLKLGPGARSDVEFAVQLLQMIHGAGRPAIRTPSTKAALEQLSAENLLDADAANMLTEAFELCERVRNRRYLLTGSPSDLVPTDDAEARRVGRMLGFAQRPASTLHDEYHRVTRRCREAFERVFYERS